VRRIPAGPPATIITAEIDPLQSDGKRYADRLREAGVPVTFKNVEGVTHEFFGTARSCQMRRTRCSWQGERGGPCDAAKGRRLLKRYHARKPPKQVR
jgi:acetyl esterase/lipase